MSATTVSGSAVVAAGIYYLPGRAAVAGAVAMFQLQRGLILSLYPRTELAKDANVPLGPPKTGELSIAHAVASKADMDALLDRARAAGATLTNRPMIVPGESSGYFRDPDGHRGRSCGTLGSTSTVPRLHGRGSGRS